MYRTMTAPTSTDAPTTEVPSTENDPTGGHTLRERTQSLTEQMVSITHHTTITMHACYIQLSIGPIIVNAHNGCHMFKMRLS